MTFLVVLTDQVFPDVEIETAALASIGATLTIAPLGEDPIALAETADALLTTYYPIDAAAVGRLTRCKVIARYGIGVDNIDLQAAKRAGIVVTNVPDYSVEEVAAHTLMLILAAVRRLPEGVRLAQKRDRWLAADIGPISRLSSLTVGLIGLGRIGRRVASLLQPLGCRLVGYDPLVSSPPDGVQALDDMNDVLAMSEVVTLHLPLTLETRHLIRGESIAHMRDGAVLVNTSRGGLVDTADLVNALKSGRVGYAALDVLEHEPDDKKLFEGLRNVLITPHMAYYSTHAVLESQQKAVAQVIKVLTGTRPDYPVN